MKSSFLKASRVLNAFTDMSFFADFRAKKSKMLWPMPHRSTVHVKTQSIYNPNGQVFTYTAFTLVNYHHKSNITIYEYMSWNQFIKGKLRSISKFYILRAKLSEGLWLYAETEACLVWLLLCKKEPRLCTQSLFITKVSSLLIASVWLRYLSAWVNKAEGVSKQLNGEKAGLFYTA